jgi:hypothetical protein
MPKVKKHTPEQIVAILRRLESGETAEAVSPGREPQRGDAVTLEEAVRVVLSGSL